MQIKKAQRQACKLRIGLSGTSGSGKTYSALQLAKGLSNGNLSKVVVIDTEQGSSNLYEHIGEFSVLELSAPYSPERYIEAIKACEDAGFEVIIIDSSSHEWEGEGGCLDIQTKLGGKYQDWAKITPRHNNFLQKITTSKAHIITTARRKQDYQMVESGGKMRVEKAGLKEIQREGFEYELTLAFHINQNHLAETSKDRTGIFMDRPEFTITPETGEEILKWAMSGKQPEKASKESVKKAKSYKDEEGNSRFEKYLKYINKSEEELMEDDITLFLNKVENA